jgi:hypothetical protein
MFLFIILYFNPLPVFICQFFFSLNYQPFLGHSSVLLPISFFHPNLLGQHHNQISILYVFLTFQIFYLDTLLCPGNPTCRYISSILDFLHCLYFLTSPQTVTSCSQYNNKFL